MYLIEGRGGKLRRILSIQTVRRGFLDYDSGVEYVGRVGSCWLGIVPFGQSFVEECAGHEAEYCEGNASVKNGGMNG